MKCLKYQKRFVQLVNKNTIATFSVKCNVILNVTYKWSISFQYHIISKRIGNELKDVLNETCIFVYTMIQAYKKWVSIHGEEPLLPGVNLTHDQLFFLNYAQIWCGSMRPEDALTKIRSSVHSPGPIRVLGPLSNSEDFARAYNCPSGSPMNPTQKCNVWWVHQTLKRKEKIW